VNLNPEMVRECAAGSATDNWTAVRVVESVLLRRLCVRWLESGFTAGDAKVVSKALQPMRETPVVSVPEKLAP